MKLQLSVKELAEIVKISPETIRFYCKSGIFEATGRTEKGYRYFGIEKIEELRFITYLRHLDVPLNEIVEHLKNRNIKEYKHLLETQLEITEKELSQLELIKIRLKNRLKYLSYMDKLPELDKINIQEFQERKYLKLEINLKNQYEFEKAILDFEKLGSMPPSLIIGDQGFIVDMNKWKSRTHEEFTGMYMIADDPYSDHHILLDTLPSGKWVTVYLKGDHKKASSYYSKIIEFAKENKLTLADYALERILMNQFITDDSSYHITEIQIPIIKK